MRKMKWTVERPPRVYEVAIVLSLSSRETLHDLQQAWGFEGKSASSKVPLPMALSLCQWWSGRGVT